MNGRYPCISSAKGYCFPSAVAKAFAESWKNLITLKSGAAAEAAGKISWMGQERVRGGKHQGGPGGGRGARNTRARVSLVVRRRKFDSEHLAGVC